MAGQNPVQEIIIDFSYETQNEDGDQTIHAYTLDGRILLLTTPNATKMAELKKAEALFGPSDENLQRKGRPNPDEDLPAP